MDPLEELDEDLVEPEVLLELDSDLVEVPCVDLVEVPELLVEVSRFTEVVRPVLSVVLIVVRVAPLLFTRVSTVVLGVRIEVVFVLVAVVLLERVEVDLVLVAVVLLERVEVVEVDLVLVAVVLLDLVELVELVEVDFVSSFFSSFFSTSLATTFRS